MYENQEKIVKYGFGIAIVFILIAGIIAGIMSGYSLRTPTEEALEAIADLSDTLSYEYRYDYKETYEIAQQKEWSGTGTLVMFGIWCASALAAFLLYIKYLQIELIDTTMCCTQRIESKLNSLALYRIAEKKAEEPSHEVHSND